jgi:hypothetical protein
MPRESLDALDDLTEEAPCQVALGQLEDEGPGVPSEAPAGFEASGSLGICPSFKKRAATGLLPCC